MSTLTIDQIADAIDVTCDTVIRNEKYFSDLDGLAGDGDFGTSLATGFKVIKADLPAIEKAAIGAMLLKISMICSKHVGGSSGPIWGTGFMKAGMASKDMAEVTYHQLTDMVGAALEGIMARGGAKRGDKTLLDALIPIHEKMQEMDGSDLGAVLAAVAAEADKAIDETRTLVAHRGRASQVGERSANTPDPGIVGVATILYDWCKHYGVDYTPTAAELNR
ncbi:dihydroxyacetone kinase subunit DhaL [Alteraurantiacibacter aquimixticola]|uniref:Dihydroxyacetone kinase subunit L n=1 Tax=Alteraurantiacibacter aquimixticola TaxID=2489173 RepID=A0A4T3EYG2_9SPHN|nr:dihydroxyacetone kinase subunit DhaL [Alteraurantiacibacter aquimixticola]TIX49699.1 dihydroxyacetone kinase subunit L [Alteraurantiacibacter aquimixticola]